MTRFASFVNMRRGVTAASALVLGLAGVTFVQPAEAQSITGTTGFQNAVTGGAILTALGFTNPLFQPTTIVTPPLKGIDFTTGTFNMIANPYMACVMGVSGTLSIPYAAGQLTVDDALEVNAEALTLTHNLPGMLSFGNVSGSLRYANDNLQGMNGNYTGESYDNETFSVRNRGGRPIGYGVWPLPGYYQTGFTSEFDYSAFLSANVDGVLTNGTVTGGTTIPVVGNDAKWITSPTFRNSLIVNGVTVDNALISEADIGNGLSINQQVTLFRNTARMQWIVNNTSAISHTLFLKFVVNERAAHAIDLLGNAAPVIKPYYYYADPVAGPTLRDSVFGVNPDGNAVTTIPTTVDIYGARYQTDDITYPPFHTTHYFDPGIGSTTPTTVYVGDSADMYPIGSSFSPPIASVRLSPILNGIATAVYFTVNVPALGSSSPVVTFFGNGASTDTFDPDFCIGTEAEEAFQYNSNAINTLTTSQRSNPSLTDTAKAFLSPSQLTVFGSVYNRQLSEAQFNVVLPNVQETVTLPAGLEFGINPGTGNTDTPTKSLGDVPGDTDAKATWVVEPTGDTFGTVNYQFTGSIGGISPLARTVSRAVSIPATPLVNVTANSYQMIGFPFDFDPTITNNGDTSSIINGLSQPTDNNPGSKVFYYWQPDTTSDTGAGKYVPTTNVSRGVGYYYRPAISRLLFLNGAEPNAQSTPVSPTATVQFYQTVMEAGWNMITDPWVYAIPVDYLSFATIDPNVPVDDLNYVPFASAVQGGIISGGIFFYDTTAQSYDFLQDFTQPMVPYQAYWFFLTDRQILRISVPSQHQSAILTDANGNIPPTKQQEVAGALRSGKAFPVNQSAENWKIQLTAKRVASGSAPAAQDLTTLVGVSPSAKDGDDTQDLPKPPPVVTNAVSMQIMHTLKSGHVGRYAQDIQSPTGTKTWNLQVLSDTTGQVRLGWPNTAQLPKTVKLVLTDNQTGRQTLLRNTSSALVNVTANVPSKFTLVAEKQNSRPLAFTGIQMTNSGTRAQGGGSNISVSFQVTSDATVNATITTLSGKTVGVLATGRAVAANGATRLVWDGRAQGGTSLPAGPYTLVLSAQTEDGENVTERRPMILLR